jgi:hypothetical protein
MQPIRSTQVYSANGLCGWHDGFAGFYLVVSGVPEHVRKQQEAERKFQEAEQQRRYQEIANLLAEITALQESFQNTRAPEFPRFNGEDPETWSCRAEQFLSITILQKIIAFPFQNFIWTARHSNGSVNRVPAMFLLLGQNWCDLCR